MTGTAQGGYAQAPGNYNLQPGAQRATTGGAQTPPGQGGKPTQPGTGQPQGGFNMGNPQNPLNPSYMTGLPMGRAAQSGANVSPQATLQQILAGFMPQARQSQDALNNQLAAAGIVGGGAQDATQMLQSQLASALAPTLGNAIQSSQGMTLQQSLANQQARNQMTGLNISDIMQGKAFNAQARNQAGSQLASMMQQGWQLPYQAQSELYNQYMGGAGNLAGAEASNFVVQPQQSLLQMLGL